MSTALYRRYRPETFDDVIGQEHVTAPLMTALQKNRVNHAYLFSGPRGCGKTTSARILARCLNCAEGPTAHPCGVCASCQDLARDGAGSLDVIEMDAASHGGVDHARDLRERATFAPVRDRYKIFIIDEAHMVTREGFNALLKIVEEPPEHIKFIFATTEPNKVLGTIRSRTHHYPFRLVAPEVLRGYLTDLCAKENVQVEQGVLPLVVRAGGGSVRDSLSVLDQLMAGADQDGITYDLAVALLGFTHAELLDGVVDAFAAGDSPAVFHAVDRVVQTGQDPRRFVEDLLERFRDLIIIKAVPDSAGQILHGMPEDQIDRMRAQATQLGSSELSRAADISNAALTEMTGATSPQLHLELLCARILLPTAEDSSRGVNARVDRLERRVNMGEVGAVPAPLQTDPAAVTTPETPAEHLASQRDQPTAEPGSSARETALSMARQNRASESPAESGGPTSGETPHSTADTDTAHDPRPAAPSQDSPQSVAEVQPDQRTQPSPQGSAEPPRPEPSAGTAPPKNSAPRGNDSPEPAPNVPRPSSGSGDGTPVTMIERSWADIIAAVGTYSKVGQATFRECSPTRFDAGVLYVASSGPGIQSRVERFAPALANAVKDTLGIDCRVALDDGPQGGPSGPAGPSTPEPNRPVAGPPDAPRDANGSDDWPGDDAWQRAAHEASSGHQAQGSPRGEAQNPRPSATADNGTPISDGPRGGESAWRQHGAPREDAQEPQWSDDSSGESFSGWQVAPIPGDDPAPDQDRGDQAPPEDSGSPHASAETAQSDTPAGMAGPTGSDAAPRPEESADEASGSHAHLRVVPAEGSPEAHPAEATDEPVSPANASGAEAPRDIAGSQGPAPSPAHAEPSGHPGRAPEREPAEPAHDWSVAARSVGAPGHPVKGRECGWRYSGPESEDRATEHPSKWGQRTPHLTEVGGDSEMPAEDAQKGPSSRRTDKAERHLHAVKSDDEPGEAAENPNAADQSPQSEGYKPSFRERHAATIAANSTQPQEHQMARGRYGDVPVDPNAPEPPDDEWEGFEPSAQDEDVEDSAVFGQAAIETILGGRVLEERPHHRG
ncbi:DNA polymerase III subunit gamma and tau [Curtobacterium sp. S6]|uniref:DNA polymerase III subunit gamma and tau n=1 Tax=Curtobacterium sp. S6 TaxID=1479623 RepID=UPI0004AB1186|nr:DNA polymerase III subunit gamma and tau [Curtobacterium sp. S6]